jgi:hypothetical protein
MKRIATSLISICSSCCLCNPAAASVARFGNWLAVCDNLRSCWIYGSESASRLTATSGYLLIRRTGEPLAPASVTFRATWRWQRGRGDVGRFAIWSVLVDRVHLGHLRAAAIVEMPDDPDTVGGHYYEAKLAAENVGRFFRSIRRARSLLLWEHRSETLRFDLTEAARAMRWVDGQQFR